MTNSIRSRSSIRLLGVVGVLGLVSTACGSAKAVVAKAKPSTTAAIQSPSATLLPLAPPPPVGPLVAFNFNNHAASLYSVGGTLTASLPATSPYEIISPLDGSLLGEKRSPTGVVSALVRIASNGSVTPLETIANPADFVDSIGSDGSDEWAWMLKGKLVGCSGELPSAVSSDVYISSTPGTGRMIAALPPLQAGVQWQFYRWTAAGIVLTQGGPPGCYSGPRINEDPTVLLNPTTGVVKPLDPQVGSDPCVLQDIADDGTIACIPHAVIFGTKPPAATTTVLRIVFPDGTQHNIIAGPFLAGCAPADGAAFGDVSLGGGSDLVSLTRYCADQHNPGNQIEDTWLIDTETMNVAKVDVSGLDAMGWIPGTSTLIASESENVFPVLYETYAVSANGAATKLANVNADIVSFAHEG